MHTRFLLQLTTGDDDAKVDKPINDVQSLHDFEFNNGVMKMWRFYNVGVGVTRPTGNWCHTFVMHTMKQWPLADADDSAWIVQQTAQSQSSTRQHQAQNDGTPALFVCPAGGCQRTFQTADDVSNHIKYDVCNYG